MIPNISHVFWILTSGKHISELKKNKNFCFAYCSHNRLFDFLHIWYIDLYLTIYESSDIGVLLSIELFNHPHHHLRNRHRHRQNAIFSSNKFTSLHNGLIISLNRYYMQTLLLLMLFLFPLTFALSMRSKYKKKTVKPEKHSWRLFLVNVLPLWFQYTLHATLYLKQTNKQMHTNTQEKKT